jgi:hypothetical protein
MNDSEKPSNFDARAGVAKYYVVWRNSNGQLTVKACGKAVTPEALTFLEQLELAEKQISDKYVILDNYQRDLYRTELLSYAQTGLEYGDVPTGRAALSWFEKRVADEVGPALRRRHIIVTLKMSALIGLPSALIALAVPHFIPPSPDFPYLRETTLLQTVLWMLVGNCLGIVFFAFVRNLEIRFDQLSKFDPAKLEPWLRFCLVAVTTAIFAVLLGAGVLQVGIGGKLLNDFISNPLICIVVGVLAGYSDTAITALLTGALRPDTKTQAA